jgi:beta-glucanase (GH16 family)
MTEDPAPRAPALKVLLGTAVALLGIALAVVAVRGAFTSQPVPTPSPSTPVPSAPVSPTPAEPSVSPSPTPTPALPAGPCGAGILKPDGTPWQCTFSDDFDGTALDTSKWTPLTTAVTGLTNGGDCWMSSPVNIALQDGVLRLTTRREAEPFRCSSLGGTGFMTQYSSGSISTTGKFNQAYGRFSFRAKFPRGDQPGVMASLWMHPFRQKYGKWPDSGEIDVAEYFSRYPDRAIPYIHYKTAEPDSSVTNTSCVIDKPWKFHTYTAVWEPGHIVISFDDKVCIDHHVNAAAPLTGSQPFDQPFSIHLSQCLGGADNRISDKTKLPATTEVDWVRIWS